MLNGEEYSSAKSFTTLNSVENTRRKKNKNNKRRFSDEQIKSLEVMFESESKLEPPKKLQLARELGLQPRQVAIWFQNKRARWKSKKLERDYSILEANYNSLATKFEVVKKEKQALTIQLKKLNDRIQKPREEKSQCCSLGLERSCNDGESYNGDTTNIRCKSEAKPSLCSEKTEHVVGVFSDDDDDTSIKAEYFGLEEEPHLLNNMVEPADGSLTSSDNWGSLDTDGLFDESSSSYQWWDFWS